MADGAAFAPIQYLWYRRPSSAAGGLGFPKMVFSEQMLKRVAKTGERRIGQKRTIKKIKSTEGCGDYVGIAKTTCFSAFWKGPF